MRKRKKPTAKEAIERMQAAERELVLAKLELNESMKNASVKFDLLIKIFEAALDSAGTIGEARRWYKEWTKDINAVEDASDIDAVLKKHGFEINVSDAETNLFRETV